MFPEVPPKCGRARKQAYLNEGGTAGFVMATGELARLEVCMALVEHDYADCMK